MKQDTPSPRGSQGWGLLLVQTVACAAVILLVLTLRLVGGNLFADLCGRFTEAVNQNALAEVLSRLFTEEEYTEWAEPTETAAAQGNIGSAVWSVAGAAVSSAYGWRTDPLSGESAFHDGVDLAAAESTPVAAALGGTVTAVDGEGASSWGRSVTVESGEFTLFYAHCERVTVAAGQSVSAGQTLATVGQTGRTTGPHLHLRVTRAGQTVNPLWLWGGDA